MKNRSFEHSIELLRRNMKKAIENQQYSTLNQEVRDIVIRAEIVGPKKFILN